MLSVVNGVIVAIMTLLSLRTFSTSHPRVAIRVSGQVVMVGGMIRASCKVPKDPSNRSIDIALIPYRSSTRPMDGDRAAITYDMVFEHIPCDVNTVACTLTNDTGGVFRASLPVEVSGCQP